MAQFLEWLNDGLSQQVDKTADFLDQVTRVIRGLEPYDRPVGVGNFTILASSGTSAIRRSELQNMLSEDSMNASLSPRDREPISEDPPHERSESGHLNENARRSYVTVCVGDGSGEVVVPYIELPVEKTTNDTNFFHSLRKCRQINKSVLGKSLQLILFREVTRIHWVRFEVVSDKYVKIVDTMSFVDPKNELYEPKRRYNDGPPIPESVFLHHYRVPHASRPDGTLWLHQIPKRKESLSPAQSPTVGWGILLEEGWSTTKMTVTMLALYIPICIFCYLDFTHGSDMVRRAIVSMCSASFFMCIICLLQFQITWTVYERRRQLKRIGQLGQIKTLFLFSSGAVLAFWRQKILPYFIMIAQNDKQATAENSAIAQAPSSRNPFWVLMFPWLFKSTLLPANITRLEWVCRCGHISYDNFATSPRSVEVLASRLVASGAVTRANLTNRRTSLWVDITSSINNSVVKILRQSSNVEQTLPSSRGADLSPRTLPQDPVVATGGLKFLALCLHTGTFAPRLTHLRLCPTSDDGTVVNADQELFRQLRKLYHKERKKFAGLTLRGIYFVKFFLRPMGYVDRLKENQLPPKDNNDYEYSLEEGQDEEAPVGPEWMLHLLHHPEHAADSTICLDAFPKKKDERLAWRSGRGDIRNKNVGWGIYIKEEFTNTRLSCARFLLVSGAGVLFSVCWKQNNGETIPWGAVGWLAVIAGLVLDWVEAWLTKFGEKYGSRKAKSD